MFLRLTCRLILVCMTSALLAVLMVLGRSEDPLYSFREWLFFSRFHRYDPVIRETASKYQLDPFLVKAIVWRESSFEPSKVGKSGERGLMQLMPEAALEWSRAERVENFDVIDLHSPKTNIEAGSWYLHQALDHWSSQDDPVPFALAEYNAGRRRVDRWIKESSMGARATARDLVSSISFPGTRTYIEDICERYRFYKNRGRM